jgi:hypothetical protein
MDQPFDREAQVAAVKARRERDLLGYPNVVGVASGRRVRGGTSTDELCVMVLVERKLPESELDPGAILPREIDGVPVDVVEAGRPKPLGAT